MRDLIYSVLKYKPSFFSEDQINLGVVIWYPDTGYRRFFYISEWDRVSAFDRTLNIQLVQDLMEAIKTEVEAPSNSQFDIGKFCSKYNGELHFDAQTVLQDISESDLRSCVEGVKSTVFGQTYDGTTREMKRISQTAFCINCGCENKYRKITEKTETEVRGVQFNYTETLAICEKCGEELYIPEINDSNAQAREDAYRKAAKLRLSPDITEEKSITSQHKTHRQ